MVALRKKEAVDSRFILQETDTIDIKREGFDVLREVTEPDERQIYGFKSRVARRIGVPILKSTIGGILQSNLIINPITYKA